MKRDYPHLSQPIMINKTLFRNRMVSAPLGSTDINAEGTPGPRTLAWYETRAKGGAAAVTMSDMVVHTGTDPNNTLKISLSVTGQLAAFAYCADAIKRHGAVASVQLGHGGMFGGSYILDKKAKAAMKFYGPSVITRPDGLQTTELNYEQMAEIAAAHADKAALLKRAGFNMIQLHFGHGWLVNQFLSPFTNKRTDKYGGSLENRLRFAIEILEAVRGAVGKDFPIELRMSGAEFYDGGYDLAEGARIAHGLQDYVDIIHVSAGSYQKGFPITHPSMFRDHGCNVFLAAEIKKHVNKPVATVGALNDPAQMEEIIASGQADIIVLGRALIADPELPNKVVTNRSDDIVRCLRCFACMSERVMTYTRRCSVNPVIGHEIEGLEVPLAKVQKKVLVVGGGIAGMKAALTASERGHNVTLVEKTGELGGILNTEETIPFKYEMYLLGRSYKRFLEKAGVNIVLNTEATAEWVEEFAPDALIIAAGSRPVKPPIPGIDNANAVNIHDYYLDRDSYALGDNIVILGGGQTGCECALHLTQEGKNCQIVEMQSDLSPDAFLRHRTILLAELEKAKITIHLNTRGQKITDEGLEVVDETGASRVIKADSVIIAAGQQSRSEVVDELWDSVLDVRVIGDAKRPANICTAMYEAYHAALDI